MRVTLALLALALTAVAILGSSCRLFARGSSAQGLASAPSQAQGGSLPKLSFRQLPVSTALEGAGMAWIADLNDDGYPDVLTAASPESADVSELRVALGLGDGSFRPGQSLTVPFPSVNCCASADFNADGRVDIALAAHDSYIVWLLHGDAKGSVALSAEPLSMASGGSAHTHSLMAADMNGDGLADLLSTCADDNAIAVQLQQPGGRFSPAPGSPFPAGEHPYEALSCVDVSSDGNLDCVVPNLMGSAISVLLGDGTGALAQAPASPTGAAAARPGFLAVGDLDGDGDLDIVSTHDDVETLSVLHGDGSGGFVLAPGPPRAPERMWSISIVDLDGDGHSEVVGAGIGGSIHVFSAAQMAASRPVSQAVAVTGGALQYLQLADFDADGRLDLLGNFWDNGDSVVLLQE